MAAIWPCTRFVRAVESDRSPGHANPPISKEMTAEAGVSSRQFLHRNTSIVGREFNHKTLNFLGFMVGAAGIEPATPPV